MNVLQNMNSKDVHDSWTDAAIAFVCSGDIRNNMTKHENQTEVIDKYNITHSARVIIILIFLLDYSTRHTQGASSQKYTHCDYFEWKCDLANVRAKCKSLKFGRSHGWLLTNVWYQSKSWLFSVVTLNFD